jgi:hypothetical protein
VIILIFVVIIFLVIFELIILLYLITVSSSILFLLLSDMSKSLILHLRAEFGEPLDNVGQAFSHEVWQLLRVCVYQGCQTEDHSTQFEFVRKRWDVDQ